MLVVRVGILVAVFGGLLSSPAPAAADEPVPNENVERLPDEAISELRARVESLAKQGFLRRGQVKRLTSKLDHAELALQQGRALRVTWALFELEWSARGLVRAKLVPAKEGWLLVNGAADARRLVRTLAFTPRIAALPPSPNCSALPECPYREIHVNSRGDAGDADGTVAAPFGTISEALAAAAKSKACAVELVLARGVYREDVAISRSTRLRGVSRANVIIEGSILNFGGYDLGVERLTLRNSPSPGAIVVDSVCPSRTELRGLSIEDATRYGVRHGSGSLTMFATTITGTRPQLDDGSSGAGVYVDDGAQAVLTLSQIADSGGAGLIADGPETKVYAAAVLVTDSDLNPALLDAANEPEVVLGAAGVEVRNQALLLMQFFQIRNSALSGLSVRTGARAAARYGTVASTYNDVDAPFGGLNAVAAEGSILDLSRFTLTRGALAGIYIGEAYANSRGGLISYNPIGAAVFPETAAPLFPPEDVVQCVLDSNAFVGNERAFDGPFLPLPCDGDACPVPACPVVPFVCDWCE